MLPALQIGRLALPWLFVGLFVSSFGLPQPWAAILVAMQAIFYGLAALDLVLPSSSALKRLATPARTVVTMLAAAALAVSVFFVPPQRLWVVSQARRRD